MKSFSVFLFLPLCLLLLFELSLVNSWHHNWCPNVNCSEDTPHSTSCGIQVLLIVIPDNPLLRDDILLNLLDNLHDKIPIHLVNDKIFFQLSEIYIKIFKMKSKSLDAFVHDAKISLHELRSSLQNILYLSSQNSQSQKSQLFLINSTFYDIRSYDQLRKSFPCTRAILFKHSKEVLLNIYIQKFLPNYHLLSQSNEIQKINWLEMWNVEQNPSSKEGSP